MKGIRLPNFKTTSNSLKMEIIIYNAPYAPATPLRKRFSQNPSYSGSLLNEWNQLTKFRDFTPNSLKKKLIAYKPPNTLQRHLGVDFDKTHFAADLYSMKGIRLPNFKTTSNSLKMEIIMYNAPLAPETPLRKRFSHNPSYSESLLNEWNQLT
ncbi:hypothetical protein TNCV_531301 [Trichonephila clavipes]|nr:hypothetical protein TNCV_531301 [Trichonephila clavipes]